MLELVRRGISAPFANASGGVARAVSLTSSPPSSQLLQSFSVELIAPSNSRCGEAFAGAYDKLSQHPKLGFITIGGMGSLLTDNMHVASLLQRRRRDIAAAAQQSSSSSLPSHPMLNVNVVCRGLNKEIIDASIQKAMDAHVNGLCILRGAKGRGTAPSSSTKEFAPHPTDVLKLLQSGDVSSFSTTNQRTALTLSVGATAVSPKLETSQDEDWRYVEEKIRLGAEAVFCTPMLNLDDGALEAWLKRAHRATVVANRRKPASTTSSSVNDVLAIPCVLAAVSPKLLKKMTDARGLSIPEELDGPLRVGLLPPHPNSPLDEDQWEANTARVFKRIMTTYTATRIAAALKSTVAATDAGGVTRTHTEPPTAPDGNSGTCTTVVVPRHVHIVTYENSAEDVLRLVDAIQ